MRLTSGDAAETPEVLLTRRDKPTHRLLSSSFLGLPSRNLNKCLRAWGCQGNFRVESFLGVGFRSSGEGSGFDNPR